MTYLPTKPTATVPAANALALTDVLTVTQGMRAGTTTLGTVGNLLGAALGVAVPVVILDTDIASDCDDVGDVAMVCQAVLTGAAQCLAMVACNLHPNGATGLKVLVDYALPGHNILIGQYNGTTLSTSASYNGSSYLNQIVSRFGNGTQAFPNHVNVVRRALAYAKAGSVSYVMTGFGSALAGVLASGADGASPLTGQALFQAKVKSVFWEAGLFPSSGTSAEFNVAADIAAARSIVSTLATLGVPIVFCGDEVAGTSVTGTDRITAAPPSGTLPTTSPFEYAFELFGYSAATPRNAWGNTAVWPAIYGLAPLFSIGGSNGTVTITSAGINSWAASPASGQSYIARLASVAAASASFNAAIALASGNHSVVGATWGLGAGFPPVPTVASGTGTTSPAGTAAAPLDALSAAALAAWSFRKLRTAWAGSAIRVQRSSDAAQRDVGFGSDGALDAATLLAFAGSAACYVVTWYDQSGNGLNLMQPAANNALIASGGAVLTAGSLNRSAATFIDTALNGLRATAFPLGGTTCTVTAVAAQTSNTQFKNLVGYQASGQAHHYDNNASASLLVSQAGNYAIGTNRNAGATGGAFVADTSSGLFVATALYDATNGNVYRDRIAGASYASTGTFGPTGTLDVGWVFDGVDLADAWAGPVAEVIIHASALGGADRTALWNNLAAFYGTP